MFKELICVAAMLSTLCLTPISAVLAQGGPRSPYGGDTCTGRYQCLGPDVNPADSSQYFSEQDAQSHCPEDTVVWVNTETGVYYSKAQKLYGNNKGVYECRKEAKFAGNRAEKNTEQEEQELCPDDTVVWVSNLTGTYYLKGQTRYADGGSESGRYECRTEAQIKADRWTTKQGSVFKSELKAGERCGYDNVIWLDTTTGSYFFKGQRWYGKTKHGVYGCRKEADVEGDRVTGNGQ